MILWQKYHKQLEHVALVSKFPKDANRGRWIRGVILSFRNDINSKEAYRFIEQYQDRIQETLISIWKSKKRKSSNETLIENSLKSIQRISLTLIHKRKKKKSDWIRMVIAKCMQESSFTNALKLAISEEKQFVSKLLSNVWKSELSCIETDDSKYEEFLRNNKAIFLKIKRLLLSIDWDYFITSAKGSKSFELFVDYDIDVSVYEGLEEFLQIWSSHGFYFIREKQDRWTIVENGKSINYHKQSSDGDSLKVFDHTTIYQNLVISVIINGMVTCIPTTSECAETLAKNLIMIGNGFGDMHYFHDLGTNVIMKPVDKKMYQSMWKNVLVNPSMQRKSLGSEIKIDFNSYVKSDIDMIDSQRMLDSQGNIIQHDPNYKPGFDTMDELKSNCWVVRRTDDAFRVVEKESSLHVWRKDDPDLFRLASVPHWIQSETHKKGLNWNLSQYKDLEIGSRHDGYKWHMAVFSADFWSFVPSKEALAVSRTVDFKSTYLSSHNDYIGNILELEHSNLVHCRESSAYENSGRIVPAYALMKINTNGWRKQRYEDDDDSKVSFENNLFKLGLG